MTGQGRRGEIRVGIGGWTYEPWRGRFYPAGLPHRRELEHAASRLTTIEINGTYYGSQKPESFIRWYDETPDDFVFALKAPRFATGRRVLAEAGASVERFLDSGVAELRAKLGPINWQFPPTKRYDPDDFAAFIDLLPDSIGGLRLRHAVELRHESFRHADVVALTRERGIAIVVAGDSDYPLIAEPTAPFVYVRIMGTTDKEPLGYGDAALQAWADRARAFASGHAPPDLHPSGPTAQTAPRPAPQPELRDVFMYVVGGHKVANPDAAQALIGLLG